MEHIGPNWIIWQAGRECCTQHANSNHIGPNLLISAKDPKSRFNKNIIKKNTRSDQAGADFSPYGFPNVKTFQHLIIRTRKLKFYRMFPQWGIRPVYISISSGWSLTKRYKQACCAGCNSTSRQNPPIQQNHRHFWSNTAISRFRIPEKMSI